jgi:Trk K+ transport system NAD-binding subunit
MRQFAFVLGHLTTPKGRRDLKTLVRLLAAFVGLALLFSVLFHAVMEYEGQRHSWVTSVYWTLVMMSTLGLGDITFTSDLGRIFSIVVLLAGTLFMLVLLPFTFIQFFYLPWTEAQAASRAPRQLPPDIAGHVILTGLGPVDAALIRQLQQFQIPYAVIVPEVAEALRVHDLGHHVMVGELDDPESYRRARVGRAALVATTRSDTANTNVAFTVREISESVPIVAVASAQASIDILELAGCSQVLQLAEMLGQSLARRILGRDARSHVIGRFGELLIAEAAAADTPLVGQRLRDLRRPLPANVSVVGVWERGRFEIPGPDTEIHAGTVLVLAGLRADLDAYDEAFAVYRSSPAPVVIIGGGRVGRATGNALRGEGIDYRIVERLPERLRDRDRYVLGDAAELEVLHQAGIQKAPSVVITTHDDDMNVYLTIYCRRLRPDIQILGRVTLERNVTTLRRAGADFVLSYASMGAHAIFNALRTHDSLLLLAEGVSVFRVTVPPSMQGRTIAECAVRAETGCRIVAVARGEHLEINPDPRRPLPADGDLIVIADTESENRFLDRFARA